jgi:hypothetical protein
LVRLRSLRLPHRHSRRVHSVTPSRYQSADNPLREVVGRALE